VHCTGRWRGGALLRARGRRWRRLLGRSAQDRRLRRRGPTLWLGLRSSDLRLGSIDLRRLITRWRRSICGRRRPVSLGIPPLLRRLLCAGRPIARGSSGARMLAGVTGPLAGSPRALLGDEGARLGAVNRPHARLDRLRALVRRCDHRRLRAGRLRDSGSCGPPGARFGLRGPVGGTVRRPCCGLSCGELRRRVRRGAGSAFGRCCGLPIGSRRAAAGWADRAAAGRLTGNVRNRRLACPAGQWRRLWLALRLNVWCHDPLLGRPLLRLPTRLRDRTRAKADWRLSGASLNRRADGTERRAHAPLIRARVAAGQRAAARRLRARTHRGPFPARSARIAAPHRDRNRRQEAERWIIGWWRCQFDQLNRRRRQGPSPGAEWIGGQRFPALLDDDAFENLDLVICRRRQVIVKEFSVDRLAVWNVPPDDQAAARGFRSMGTARIMLRIGPGRRRSASTLRAPEPGRLPRGAMQPSRGCARACAWSG